MNQKKQTNEFSVSASEIGQFFFCEQAWYLNRQGAANTNKKDIQRGLKFHAAYGWRISWLHLTRVIILMLLILLIGGIVWLGLKIKMLSMG